MGPPARSTDEFCGQTRGKPGLERRRVRTNPIFGGGLRLHLVRGRALFLQCLEFFESVEIGRGGVSPGIVTGEHRHRVFKALKLTTATRPGTAQAEYAMPL